MKKTLSRTALVLSIIALSACANKYRVNVSTFHNLATHGNERILLNPINPRKKDSPEYKQYADVLAQSFNRHGYQETDEDTPELIANFDVIIDNGHQKISSRPGTNRGNYENFQPSDNNYRNKSNILRSGYDNGYSPSDVVTRTTPKATLILELRKPDGTLVFEGRSEMRTRRKDLPQAVPLLAEALFQDFPGDSGKTRRIIVERDTIQSVN